MRRGMVINSWQDLNAMTSPRSSQSMGFDNQSKMNQHQTKATHRYETDHSSVARSPLSSSISSLNNNHERAKSADHSQMPLNETTPMASSSSSSIHTGILNNPAKTTSRLSRLVNARSTNAIGVHSSTMYIDELRQTQQDCEKRELNTLNHRFENYLEKIKSLATINANLRRQVDDAYRKYMGLSDEQHVDKNQQIKKYQHPQEIQLNNLRKQINDEVRLQTLVQIRLQRADYDIKFYQTNIKLLGVHDQKQSEQIRTLKQQFDVLLQELEQMKHQYQTREQDLQTHKNQYAEYMNKLIHFSNEYDKITFERMENENRLCTLKEQISFEHEYHLRRQQEFEYLEKFQFNLNKEFSKNEFHYIVQQIRKDYQELNEIRLSELEKSYKTKLDTIRNEISKRDQQQEQTKPHDIRITLDSTKQEHRTLIEQNQLLTDKLEKLEKDLHGITEQNRQRYEISDREYQKLQREVPELDCVIVQLRENTGSLWSEINTYRYLLLNLFSSQNDKPSNSHSPQKEKQTISTTTTDNKSRESKNSVSMVKPIINQVTKTSVGTKAKSPQQYRDETTGFIVHIEDGIVWVRI